MPVFLVAAAPRDGGVPKIVGAFNSRGHAERAADREGAARAQIVEANSELEALLRSLDAERRLPPLQVQTVMTAADLEDAFRVRRAVFIEEQRVPEEEEIDAHDGTPDQLSTAVHVIARMAHVPVATGRLLLDYPAEANAHIGRVAVLAELRRFGLGRSVMEALHELARGRERTGITLAAQLQAIPFYERLGYVARGDVFLDAGIEHRWMDLAL